MWNRIVSCLLVGGVSFGLLHLISDRYSTHAYTLAGVNVGLNIFLVVVISSAGRAPQTDKIAPVACAIVCGLTVSFWWARLLVWQQVALLVIHSYADLCLHERVEKDLSLVARTVCAISNAIVHAFQKTWRVATTAALRIWSALLQVSAWIWEATRKALTKSWEAFIDYFSKPTAL